MITVFIADNEEKVKDIIAGLLYKEGNITIYITKQANIIKIAKNEEIKNFVPLEDKIMEIEESLCREKSGRVYKTVLELVEKPLFEHMLERTEGNQLKAARILGINRNTMNSKLRKLGINVARWKI
ncbi:MAG: helix-turn-helix domain-containing protein [Candidatus Omnitrophica bacterium]|nr:helix-turn-helix domain-containing protein [Candidatus Omnitrophota bacterium]